MIQSKMKRIFEPHVTLEPDSPVPLHHQLSEGIMRELRQCRVPAKTVVPSILALAQSLNLNRDTVRKAYAVLEEGEVIRRTPGGRILEVTEEFVRRNASESLSAIGVVLPERMENLLKQETGTALKTVAGIMDGAAELGFAAMIVPLPSEDDEVERLSGWLKKMLSKLNGLVYLGEDSRHSHEKAFEILLAEHSLPQVFISGHRFQEHLGIVKVDMESGFQAAVDTLYELGHRRFAVCGPKIPKRRIFQLQTYDRIPLLCKAVRSRVPLHDDFVFEAERGASEVIPWLKRLLSLPERPTALLCADDQEAQRVVEIVRETGLKIPQDVSVIGYGDTGLFPGLASVRHPWLQTGRAAVEMIAESWRRSMPVHQLDRVLQAPLIVLESVGEAHVVS